MKQHETNKLIKAYSEWVQALIEAGYEATLLTFMFNELNQPPAQLERTMNSEIDRVYATHLTHALRNPRATTNLCNFPVWIGCPDWPVHKHAKQHFREAAINSGRHIHVIALMPPNTRMKTPLANYFDDHASHHYGSDKLLARIHAEPITYTPDVLTRYVLKSLERKRANADDIILLPRTHSEMPRYSKAERVERKAEGMPRIRARTIEEQHGSQNILNSYLGRSTLKNKT